MDSLIKLNAILRFHESNFQNLHWNSAGEEFDDAHKDISTGYYELCNKYVDETAEMLARLDAFALNFIEVSELAQTSDWQVVDSSTLFDRYDIIEASDALLSEIIDVICECLDTQVVNETANAGIKSTLESMLDEFDIQYRYINSRRQK